MFLRTHSLNTSNGTGMKVVIKPRVILLHVWSGASDQARCRMDPGAFDDMKDTELEDETTQMWR